MISMLIIGLLEGISTDGNISNLAVIADTLCFICDAVWLNLLFGRR